MVNFVRKSTLGYEQQTGHIVGVLSEALLMIFIILTSSVEFLCKFMPFISYFVQFECSVMNFIVSF